MLSKLRDFLVRNTIALSCVAILIASFSAAFSVFRAPIWKGCPDDSSPPSVAAPAAPADHVVDANKMVPGAVTFNGNAVTAPPGSVIEITQDTTHSGGLISEQHSRTSVGTGAGFRADGDNVKLSENAGQAPTAGLGPDDSASASGGTSSFKATVVNGLNLFHALAIAAGAFAVWFITRQPANKVAALYCAAAGAGLWFLGDHPWVLIPVVLGAMAVLAWKAHLLGAAQGAVDTAVFAINKAGGPLKDAIHKEIDSFVENKERPFIAASRATQGA